MNIPENILQVVADAAFNEPIKTLLTTRSYTLPWPEEAAARRAVIQHALDNSALAPFLAGWIGEYTDKEILHAWNHRKYTSPATSTANNLRAFLSALPRRESPALAESIARAEKAEAECLSWKGNAELAWKGHAILSKELGEAVARAEKAEAELAAIKSAQLGILRPLSEMPETVPDGCVKVSGWNTNGRGWIVNTAKHPADTHCAILRLPAAKARQERPVGFNSALETWGASEATPNSDQAIADMEEDRTNLSFEAAAEPEPAAQMPLGPEDVPPGSVVRCDNDHWFQVLYASPIGVGINNAGLPVQHRWTKLAARWQINTSLPDTGRWDATAWRDCSKPAK